jgi:hypothetical protein
MLPTQELAASPEPALRALVLYGVVPALAVALVLAALVVARARSMPERGRRRLLLAGAVLGALLVFLGSGRFLVARIQQGVWFCDVCGQLERQVRLLAWTPERTPLAPDEPEAEMTRDYVAWFEGELALAHEHGWSPAGRIQLGLDSPPNAYLFPPTFHRALPRLPDAERARSLVAHLADTAPPERAELLRDFARHASEEGPSILMCSLSRAPVTAEAFAADFPAWLAEHPAWGP